jgi:serine protease Do
MKRKDILYGAVGGGLAAALVCLGGAMAAATTGGAVNPAPLPRAAAAAAAPASFADIVQRVAPAVVSIDIVGKTNVSGPAMQSGPSGGPDDDDDGDGSQGAPFDLRRFFQQQAPRQAHPLRASGSGFFISPDGYIVTNNHVVEDADKITVRTSDERTLPAHLVGRDPDTDLAVIKVDGHDLPFVSFEERAKPRVGDWVVALGNPFNLGGTATAGIVSAISRPRVSGSGYVDYMQIDAPINRGNSGGPTFDLYGRVVGVNSAIFSPSGGSVGIGFDIPADVAARVSKELIADGKVTRGYIGATVQDITPEIAESLGLPLHKGAIVADVVPDGPSQKGGLLSGDIVMQVNGRPVTSAADLTRQVALVHGGQDIHLDVRRDGASRQITVRSGVRPSDVALAFNGAGGSAGGEQGGGLGLMVAANSGGGVKVERVAPNSSAGQRGLRPGDVIEKVGQHSVNQPSDVTAAVAEARAAHRKDVLLMIARHGQHLFLPVEIASAAG